MNNQTINKNDFIDENTAFQWELCTIGEKVRYLRNYKHTQSVYKLIDTDILLAQIERLKTQIYEALNQIETLKPLCAEEMHTINIIRKATINI